jgi:hypothetical protein
MPRTTPIHKNCGTCTECESNPQIIKYTCRKGGSYKLLNGYVGSFNDICKPQTNVLATVIKSLIVGQVSGFIVFVIGSDAMISAFVCLGVSLVTYLCDEH